MRPAARCAILAALLLLAAPLAARAQTVGRLFFQVVDTGRNMIGGVDEHGRFHVLASGTQSGLAHQVCDVATDSGLLCYSPTGGGSLVQLDGTALPRFTTGFGFSPNWVSITALGSHAFFYDGQHTGVVLAVHPDATTTQPDTRTNLSPWTFIVATDNYLVFYNADSGALASAVISNIETLQQTSSGSTIVHATLFGSVGDDLMLYDPATGNYNILQILYNGSRTDGFSLGASGVLPQGYSDVVRLNRSLLFYNASTGATVIGTIDQSGPNLAAWKKTQTTKLLAGWSRPATAGQFLVFYNTLSGALSVGYISTAGKWVQTDYEANVGTGFNLVAATAR